LAALVVVASHAWRSHWNDPSGGTTTFLYSSAEHAYGGWTTDVLSTLGNGAAAVNLFFVISGFVLLQSLMRGPDSNWVNAARFVVARPARPFARQPPMSPSSCCEMDCCWMPRLSA
jgi:peptidoglycan/LPS O-acetylase OafA/YrhL